MYQSANPYDNDDSDEKVTVDVDNDNDVVQIDRVGMAHEGPLRIDRIVDSDDGNLDTPNALNIHRSVEMQSMDGKDEKVSPKRKGMMDMQFSAFSPSSDRRSGRYKRSRYRQKSTDDEESATTPLYQQ